MMMNLFSIFDPSTSMIMSMNWLSLIMLTMYLPNIYWLTPSKSMSMWLLMTKFIIKEIKTPLNSSKKFFNSLLFMSLLIMIMLNNFISMFPYIFNLTSHLSMSLSMSLPIWISLMMYGWINYTNNMFIHLTPQGTPYILMPFMVMIESISNFIRPLTLAIRLSANIIAGHLLMTLISKSTMNLNMIMIMILILVQSILMTLETSVAFIQSYVFTILSSLYSSEMN